MDRNILAIYRSLGGNLFPTKTGQVGDLERKVALFTGYQDNFTPDDLLLEYHNRGHGIGWCIPDGCFVIDIDVATPQRPAKRGADSYQRLKLDIFCDIPWVGAYGPTGGTHLYVQHPEACHIRKSLPNYPDIDFKKPRQHVLIPGSHHWQGGFYEASPLARQFGISPTTIPVAPPVLMHMLLADQWAGKPHNEAKPLDLEVIYELLSLMPTEDFASNDTWLPLAMAVHSASGGSIEARDVFHRWCMEDPQYRNATSSIFSRWDSFRCEGGVTARTLIHLARKSVMGSGDESKVARLNAAMIKAGEVTTAEEVFGQTVQAVTPMGMEILSPQSDPEPLADRPMLVLDSNNELKNLANTVQYMPAICRQFGMFVQNHKFVQVLRKRGVRQLPEIRQVHDSSVRAMLTGYLNFNRNSQDKKTKEWSFVSSTIPDQLVKAVYNLGQWNGCRELSQIVTGPVLVSPTEAITRPGYYEQSGIMYAGDDLEIRLPPLTRENAMAAMARLYDVVCDFPFVKPSHRAAWLSGMLTLIARPAIKSPVPMQMIVANQQDSGKTLLITISILTATGYYETNPMSGSDQAELEKRIVAAMMQGKTILALDNDVNGGDIGCAWLDQMLTSPILTGRILGQSQMVTLENNMTLFTTGNVLRFSPRADTARRVIVTWLDRAEKQKTNYKHGDADSLMDKVRTERPQLVTDCLTLMLAYSAAGRPRIKRAMSSYEAWDRLVRQPLLWIDPTADPVDGMKDSLLPMDSQTQATLLMVKAIAGLILATGKQWVSTGEILGEYMKRAMTTTSAFDPTGKDPLVADMDAALETVKLKGRGLDAYNLGFKIRDVATKWIGDGIRIIQKDSLWAVERKAQ